MRVCMVVYSFYESDNRVLRYAETLARRGDDVDVIALQKEGKPKCESLKGVNVNRIQKRKKDEKSKFSYFYRLLKFFILSSVLLMWKHIKHPYKLIHVHSVPDFLVFVAVIPKLLGAKVILDIHDVTPELYKTKFNQRKSDLLFKFLIFTERASCSFADHVIIANHLWYKLIVARSVKEEKCTAIMNYPDENIFFKRTRTRTDNKIIMIYPGSLNWHQGLDIAIKAFARIINNNPESEFHIYGSGPEYNPSLQLVAELNLEGTIFIHGTLPLDEIAQIMANADIGVVPKRDDAFGGEAFSTKILEFMSLGVPVIVSKTKIDDYYFNESVVQFFEPDNEQDLSQCIQTLIENEPLRNRQKENALKFVEDFKWGKKSFEYLNLVDSLVRNK